MSSNFSTEIKNGGLFIHGYGVKIRVSLNHLLIDWVYFRDGLRCKALLRLNRATCKLKRIVISGDDGYITLAALRWLEEIACSFLQIGYDNQIYASFAPLGMDRSSLRRSQSLAAFTPIGLEIEKTLLGEKITGQIRVIQSLPGGHELRSILEKTLEGVGKSEMLPEMMAWEAQASAAYWQAWEGVKVNFALREVKDVPDHWLTFRKRMSDLGQHPRKATNPANSLLNYLYAILKGETTTALWAIGLDPGIGILHSDNPSTPNLALDVMEPARPEVDLWFLDFLARRIFVRKDFYEMEDGSVRLTGAVRQELSSFGPLAFSLSSPWAEYVRGSLEKAFTGEIKFGTPLTQNNRKAGRDGYRVKVKQSASYKAQVEKRCIECGDPARSDNVYCDHCWEFKKVNIGNEYVKSGREKLAELRSTDKDPAHGGEAKRKRGDTIRQRAEDRKAWEHANPGKLESEKQRFVNTIQPLLKEFSVTAICNALSLSPRYASLIKNGLHVPHPVMYPALEAMIASQAASAR